MIDCSTSGMGLATRLNAEVSIDVAAPAIANALAEIIEAFAPDDNDRQQALAREIQRLLPARLRCRLNP